MVVTNKEQINHFLSILNRLKRVRQQKNFLEIIKGRDYTEVMEIIERDGLFMEVLENDYK